MELGETKVLVNEVKENSAEAVSCCQLTVTMFAKVFCELVEDLQIAALLLQHHGLCTL